jgi:hypothetical protein
LVECAIDVGPADWFDQMVVEPGFERASAVHRLTVSGQRYQSPGEPGLAGAARDLEAVDPRQADIDERDVGTPAEQPVEPRGAIVSAADFMAAHDFAEQLEEFAFGEPGGS